METWFLDMAPIIKKYFSQKKEKMSVMIGDIEGMYSGAYFDMQYKADVAHFNKCKVGIGTSSPAADLQVDGGIQMANESAAASSALAGTLRYYELILFWVNKI